MTLSGDYLFLTIGIICVFLTCFASMSIMLSLRIGAMFAWLAFLLIGLNLGGTTSTVKAVIISLGVIMIVMHLLQFFAFSQGKKGKV